MCSIPESKKKELSKLLLHLTKNLDITKTQFDNLSQSYMAVGKYLENDEQFADCHPVVSPQGSLRLGTIIQPINKDDDLDVDLVYRLSSKPYYWTQKTIKDKVGERLKSSERYAPMLDKEEGRRCWTLLYRDNADNPKEKYHMDILPCVSNSMYNDIFVRLSREAYSRESVEQIAIRITDKKSEGYATDTNEANWLKSNPDGYALWFASRCKQITQLRETKVEDIIPIGKYTENKTTLQRVVQLLKRHRDIMFCNDTEDKPISIIITTLAARAYKGEADIYDALVNVISSMESYIERDSDGNYVISSPVNEEENFADKWPTHPKRKENFFKWLAQLKTDLRSLQSNTGVNLQRTLSNSFGQEVTSRSYSDFTAGKHNEFSSSAAKISATGVLGSIGKKLNAANTFYGEK